MCVELGRETVTMMTSAGGCWSVDTTTVRSRRGDSGTLETTVVRPGAPLTDPVLRWDIIFLIKIIMQHQGWGPCVSDAECEDSSNGYTLCSTSCLDRSYFPLDKFPLAAAVYGYGPGDKCCRQDQVKTEILVSSMTSSSSSRWFLRNVVTIVLLYDVTVVAGGDVILMTSVLMESLVVRPAVTVEMVWSVLGQELGGSVQISTSVQT